MTSRREFIGIGITAGALPFATGAARAAGVALEPTIPLYAVVYDSRFAAGREFGLHAELLGLPARAFDGDMTSIWYHDLYHRWKQGPIAIAGMTGRGALFCFEQLARDQRMRIVFQAEHRPVTGQQVRLSMTGPAAMLSAGLHSCHASTAIGTTMAEVLANCPSDLTEPSSVEVSLPARLELNDGEEALYSWVIAPIART